LIFASIVGSSLAVNLSDGLKKGIYILVANPEPISPSAHAIPYFGMTGNS
jgi:hypothetical protein